MESRKLKVGDVLFRSKYGVYLTCEIDKISQSFAWSDSIKFKIDVNTDNVVYQSEYHCLWVLVCDETKDKYNAMQIKKHIQDKRRYIKDSISRFTPEQIEAIWDIVKDVK